MNHMTLLRHAGELVDSDSANIYGIINEYNLKKLYSVGKLHKVSETKVNTTLIGQGWNL